MSTWLENLFQPGACKFGTWIKLDTLETLELIAAAGFDFVVVDMEHSPFTFSSAYRCIVAAQGMGMKALVRLPDASGTDVQRILDSGADGVLVPRVRTAEEARIAMDGMRFSPVGSRGLGITSRAGRWGLKSIPDYIKHGNEAVMRCVQLEDQVALRDADQILGTEGVTAAFVGLGDLALSSGKPASDSENVRLVDHVLAVAAARGLPCGTAVSDGKAAREARDRGFNFVMVSNDLTLFGKAAAELVRSFRS